MIYRQALSFVDRVFLTRVAAAPEGDTFFPPLDKKEWVCTSIEPCLAGEKDDYSMEFMLFERRNMVKLNMSFEELAKRAVKVEVKKKDKPKEDKSNNTKDVDNN